MVALLKVLLPLAALGILSTLFLLSRSVVPTATIPFSERAVAERVESRQITRPYFSGTTTDGGDIVVQAELLHPGGPDEPSEAEGVSGRIVMADGVRLQLEADRVSVSPGQDRARFAGNVKIVTSTGIRVWTEQLNARIDIVAGETPGPVRATGPMGDLEAGKMEYAAKKRGDPLHMLFKNGVKLIYDPAKKKD